MTDAGMKIKDTLRSDKTPGFRKYRELCYGNTSLSYALKAEFLFSWLGPMPGGMGLLFRSRLYRSLFGQSGPRIFIGRNVTFRHPRKIRLGNNVFIDDNCLIDAKGADNDGIVIGDNVFIGRNSIVYCKNGNIVLEQNVNISSSCTLFSSNRLTVREGVIIGAYSYLLSGGEYDYANPIPFSEQPGTVTRGELVIGRNSWLGARVTVLDAASIGEHCVIGAGAVVTSPLPPSTLALGIPARPKKTI